MEISMAAWSWTDGIHNRFGIWEVELHINERSYKMLQLINQDLSAYRISRFGDESNMGHQ